MEAALSEFLRNSRKIAKISRFLRKNLRFLRFWVFLRGVPHGLGGNPYPRGFAKIRDFRGFTQAKGLGDFASKIANFCNKLQKLPFFRGFPFSLREKGPKNRRFLGQKSPIFRGIPFPCGKRALFLGGFSRKFAKIHPRFARGRGLGAEAGSNTRPRQGYELRVLEGKGILQRKIQTADPAKDHFFAFFSKTRNWLMGRFAAGRRFAPTGPIGLRAAFSGPLFFPRFFQKRGIGLGAASRPVGASRRRAK